MSEHVMDRRGFLGLAGAGIASFALSACGGNGGSTGETAGDKSAKNESANTDAESPITGQSLIVLWSWSGNTLQMAERISELSDADIYRIEAADPYPEDYEETAYRAKQEQDDGTYPEISNPVQNWDDYDTIFLGYPIWWYELPMIVQGFVNDHDWAGKTIVPFNSHLGSGNSGTYDDLREMTGATVLDGIAISGNDIPAKLDEIDTWYAALPKA